jgi:hypothetical protein
LAAPDRGRPGPRLRQNQAMRLSDRPWAETNAHGTENLRAGWDHRARPDDLVGRLTRLPVGHPSADLAGDADEYDLDPDDLGTDDLDPGDLDPGDLGTGDLDPGDLDPGDLDCEDFGSDDTGSDDVGRDDSGSDAIGSDGVGSDGAANVAATGDIRPGRRGPTPAWEELGGPARSPYRPWFGAGGATDPWFAADLIE